jgi:hypothetical protein
MNTAPASPASSDAARPAAAAPPSPAPAEPTQRPPGRVPGAPSPRPLGGSGQGLLLLGALALLAALAVAPLFPRSVAPAGAPADVFSAERALPHLQAIAGEPHPVGSPANARVRDYLLSQLAALGLGPEVQRAAVFRAPTGDGVVVENVLVRLPGAASTGAVLVTAHYDSVSSAPGAGDDGMAVASMVETLRALRASPPPRNDLIFLFNDGEEPGMYGSQAFVEQHPWAAGVRVVFDFDADSATGPTTILWTAPHDGWLLGEVARASTGLVAGPWGNPDDRQEFKNDLHVFAAAGYTGAHLDQVGGSTFYHTERDSLANVDPASLQRQGTAMLALARHFGDVPLETTRADDATLLMAFGVPVVTYPLTWALPLALALLLGFVLVIGLGLRRGRLAPRGLAAAALAVVGGAGALALVAQLAWQAVAAAHPEAQYFAERGFYGQSWFVGAVYALVLALALAAGPRLVRRVGEPNLMAAGLGATVALALLFAVATPGLGDVALWPALAGVLALAYVVAAAEPSSRRRGWVRFVVLLLAAVPVLGVMLGPLFQPVIGGVEDGPALQVVALVALAALLSPQLSLVLQAGRRWLPGAVAVVGLALLGLGVATSGFSAAQPRPDVLAYGLDADTGQACWLTLDPRLDEWTGQFLAGGTRRTLDELLGASDPVPVLAAPAPAAALPAPSLAVVSQEQAGDVRTLRLHLASARQAGRLHLWPGPGTQIVAANLGDAPPVAVDGEELLISGLPAEGIDLTVRVRASGPARFTLLDRSTGLPDLPGLPPRPATVMSAPVGEDLSGYPTLVRASYTIPPP